MKNRREIESLILEIKKILKKKKGIKEVWIFGSVVEEGLKNAEDIDIAISGKLDNFFSIYGELIFYLEKKFKKRVDLVPLDWLREKEIFLKYVKKGIRVL